MKKFGVTVPIAGHIYKEVEAENEQEAMDKIFEEGYEDDDIVELDMYEHIVEGNVCHVYTKNASAEEIKE